VRYLAVLALAFTCSTLAASQDSLPIHVHFAFGTASVAPRFREKTQKSVEQHIATQLATICSKTLHPWNCDALDQGSPILDASVQIRNDIWYLKVVLNPKSKNANLPGQWNEQQIFRAEDLIASGLPMDDGWVSPIAIAFEQLLSEESKSSKEIFAVLKEVAPLGNNVVAIPASLSPLPGAVLPLRWDAYKDMSTCRFRIYYHGKNGELITLLSSGSGGPMDFTPDAPQYKGVWVLHDTYQIGARSPEPIAAHIQELPDLTVIEFHLEETGVAPPGISIAPPE
jgi:hypothetical protein